MRMYQTTRKKVTQSSWVKAGILLWERHGLPIEKKNGMVSVIDVLLFMAATCVFELFYYVA